MTKRIAIEELEGVALDWAVNVAQSGANGIGMDDVARKLCLTQGAAFQPSTDWSQCGQLKARYKIDTYYMRDGSVRCRCPNRSMGFPTFEEGFGQDELIAACRAIVAAHNPSGFVEVPDELVEGE